MDVLAERFSAKNIVGCALKVATRLEDGGGIVQLSPVQDFAYGELDGSASDRIRRLDGFLQDAGVNARLSSAILREMWEKWILLAGLGAITCLMRGAIGEVEAVSEGAPFSSAILDEVIAVVTAVGVAPSSDFVTSARAQLTASGSPMTSSLYRDLEAGHPVEVDAIIGDLLERGEAAAVETPLLRASHIHLKVYQNRIAKRG